MLESISINPSGDIRCSVIWLHGLGADGHDFEPIVRELGIPDTWGVRFVFPHAPKLPVTINNGMVMRAWFDIAHPDLDHAPDLAGIARSVEQVAELLDHENKHAEKIFLAGFSQGGVIALKLGLQYRPVVQGILALSTYIPHESAVIGNADAGHKKIPIMLMHGQHDPIVTLRSGEKSYRFLKQNGFNVEWKTYSMPHAVIPEQIEDIGKWFREVLAPE